MNFSKKIVKLLVLASMGILSIPLISCSNSESAIKTSDSNDKSEVKIIYAKLITNSLIEIKFDQNIKNADSSSDFKVTVNGKELQKEECRFMVYFDQMVSIGLKNPVSGLDAKVKIKIVDSSICGSNGEKIADNGDINVVWDPFYKKQVVSKSGIPVEASASVKDANMKAAADMVDVMLAKRPDIAKAMADNGVKLSVIAAEQNAYYIPEHREFYSVESLYVEGLGGTIEIPTTSITEQNVARWLDITSCSTVTKYTNENILAHEFGHTVHLVGLAKGAPDLYAELNNIYESAKTKGLWPNTYAISNCEEYFATGSAIWFNVMSESRDGSWDGVRGPINTRDELKKYDIDFYNLLSKIYNPASFAAPWDKNENYFDEKGNPRK